MPMDMVAPNVTESGLATVTEPMLADLVAEMNRVGFARIPNYISDDLLSRMRDFVRAAFEASGNQYVGFVGKDAVRNSAFAEIGDAESMQYLLRRVYEIGVGKAGPNQSIYQVLRCLAGQTGRSHSLIFHYDSYVVTALIPVEIPQEGMTGDLVMWPNTRKVRGSYLLNLFDKIVLDNKITQWAMRHLYEAGILKLTRVKMVPGSIYLFWGYRSIHANEACDPQHVRATAIYHYANPHADSSFKAKLRALLPRDRKPPAKVAPIT